MSSTNYISLVDAGGNERRVRVFGNASDPHFCGKDICDIMDIENHKDVISKIISDNDKIELKNLIKKENKGTIPSKRSVCLYRTNSIGIDLKNLSDDDCRLVVLSEQGVYDLIDVSNNDKNKKILKDSIEKFICEEYMYISHIN